MSACTKKQNAAQRRGIPWAGKVPLLGLLSLLLCLPPLTCACSGKEKLESGAYVEGVYGPRTTYKGSNVSSLKGGVTSSTVVPDGDGGVIVLEGESYQTPRAGYADAREIKLKLRELAEQLIADMNDCSLQGAVALPTAFVHLDDFNRTSSFGRLISEQLIFEFNQRGYPIREYRMPGSIRVKADGEYILSRNVGSVSARAKPAVVIVGTYYNDKDAIFINARLVRPSDGRVLRTANLVMDAKPVANRMLRGGGGAYAGKKEDNGGGMRIRDAARAGAPPASPALPQTPFDRGEDIH
ncbi:hypothetical protein LJC59_09560 [Desulfovibrio sp. OttesenSCG-928-A18]|nr:hypothetical protein [Desulfovibrio sp. OttesenSCG-928-A18]